jgi:DNA-binding response OmpR family regulator
MNPKKSSAKKNILVIDADEEFSRDVRLYLEENYHVTTRQGLEFLDYTIILKKTDLLILEADYADRNLLKLIEQLKQNHPTIKILIMYTYFQSDTLIEKALVNDADDVIAKPFDVVMLKNKVDQLLSQTAVKQRSSLSGH